MIASTEEQRAGETMCEQLLAVVQPWMDRYSPANVDAETARFNQAFAVAQLVMLAAEPGREQLAMVRGLAAGIGNLLGQVNECGVAAILNEVDHGLRGGAHGFRALNTPRSEARH